MSSSDKKERGTLSWNLFTSVPYQYLTDVEKSVELNGLEVMGHYQEYNENWTAVMAVHSTRRLLFFTKIQR